MSETRIQSTSITSRRESYKSFRQAFLKSGKIALLNYKHHSEKREYLRDCAPATQRIRITNSSLSASLPGCTFLHSRRFFSGLSFGKIFIPSLNTHNLFPAGTRLHSHLQSVVYRPAGAVFKINWQKSMTTTHLHSSRGVTYQNASTGVWTAQRRY